MYHKPLHYESFKHISEQIEYYYNRHNEIILTHPDQLNKSCDIIIETKMTFNKNKYFNGIHYDNSIDWVLRHIVDKGYMDQPLGLIYYPKSPDENNISSNNCVTHNKFIEDSFKKRDDFYSESLILNIRIIDAHYKHYEKSPKGLIKPTESPNGNIIYHLYSTGEITFQKGGIAYNERNEFSKESIIDGCRTYLNMEFPNEVQIGYTKLTYAILTEEECVYFRNKMIKLLERRSSLNI